MSEYIIDLTDENANAVLSKCDGIHQEIVRCRDCVHCYKNRRNTAIGWVDRFECDSKQWSTSSLMPSHTIELDGFCAWGEFKDTHIQVPLKSCPFCGGEVQLVQRTFEYSGEYEWSVECLNAECGCDFSLYHTQEEAIKAWNTRAELTCYDRNKSARDSGAHLFLWRCSNCDESYDTEMDKMHYCPNCGRKVIE